MKIAKRASKGPEPDLRRRSRATGNLRIQYSIQPTREGGTALAYERRSRDQKVKGGQNRRTSKGVRVRRQGH
jgi:hypothetical protein